MEKLQTETKEINELLLTREKAYDEYLEVCNMQYCQQQKNQVDSQGDGLKGILSSFNIFK